MCTRGIAGLVSSQRQRRGRSCALSQILIRLIAQSAYIPELNPVEHIWEELREKQLANLALSSLDEVIDKVCDGLNQLEADPERLRSLTSFPHFRMVS